MPGSAWQAEQSELVDLPSGSDAPAAARRAVDELSRNLGELHQDVRLLVSELVTAGGQKFRGAAGLRLGISIGPKVVRVELRQRGRFSRDVWAEAAAPGQMARILMDTLTTRWGNERSVAPLLWFEIERP